MKAEAVGNPFLPAPLQRRGAHLGWVPEDYLMIFEGERLPEIEYADGFPSISCSKLNLQPSLKRPWNQSTRRSAKRGAVQIEARTVEIHPVERIKRVHSQQGREPLFNGELLCQGQVSLSESGTSVGVASQIAIRAARWPREVCNFEDALKKLRPGPSGTLDGR